MVSPKDAAGVPLIRGDDGGRDDQDANDREEYHRLNVVPTLAATVALRQEGEACDPGVWMWVLAFSAGISGLLFGCECIC
jgi:hypothetical protein